jgi:hypothetical protein
LTADNFCSQLKLSAQLFSNIISSLSEKRAAVQQQKKKQHHSTHQVSNKVAQKAKKNTSRKEVVPSASPKEKSVREKGEDTELAAAMKSIVHFMSKLNDKMDTIAVSVPSTVTATDTDSTYKKIDFYSNATEVHDTSLDYEDGKPAAVIFEKQPKSTALQPDTEPTTSTTNTVVAASTSNGAVISFITATGAKWMGRFRAILKPEGLQVKLGVGNVKTTKENNNEADKEMDHKAIVAAVQARLNEASFQAYSEIKTGKYESTTLTDEFVTALVRNKFYRDLPPPGATTAVTTESPDVTASDTPGATTAVTTESPAVTASDTPGVTNMNATGNTTKKRARKFDNTTAVATKRLTRQQALKKN